MQSSSHGRTPGLDSRGLREGLGKTHQDQGSAYEGARTLTGLLDRGPPQPDGILRPLSTLRPDSSVGRSRSQYVWDYRRQEVARRRSSPPPSSSQEMLPRRAPVSSPAPCSPPPPPPARAEAPATLGCVARSPRPAGSSTQQPHVFAPRRGAGGPQEGPGSGRPCPRGHVLLAR